MIVSDAFRTLQWLHVFYGAVATTPEFLSLSAFEQWERVCDHVRQHGDEIAIGNVNALARLDNQQRAHMLQWLEGHRNRTRREAIGLTIDGGPRERP